MRTGTRRRGLAIAPGVDTNESRAPSASLLLILLVLLLLLLLLLFKSPRTFSPDERSAKGSASQCARRSVYSRTRDIYARGEINAARLALCGCRTNLSLSGVTQDKRDQIAMRGVQTRKKRALIIFHNAEF